MLTIQITQFGKTVRMDVEQVEFMRICPYCRIEFPTVNIDRIYCKPSHGVMASRIRNFSASLPSSISTIGMRLRLRPAITCIA